MQVFACIQPVLHMMKTAPVTSTGMCHKEYYRIQMSSSGSQAHLLNLSKSQVALSVSLVKALLLSRDVQQSDSSCCAVGVLIELEHDA